MRTIKRVVSLGLCVVFGLVFYWNPFQLLEFRVQDGVFQQPGLINVDIVIIGIDEWALDQVGTFPWSRQVWADVVNILNTYEDERPAVIAFDVLFAQHSPDPYADMAFVEAVAASDNVVLAMALDSGFDFDALTLEQIVLGTIVSFDELRPHAVHGLVDAIPDADGFVRNALLRMPFEGGMYYSFPMEIAMKYTGLSAEELIPYWTPYGYLDSFISYTGLLGDYFQFSVADLFEDWFDPRELADRIVLIGPWALGMMDSHAVPIETEGQLMYGVEIHANVVQMILDNNFRERVQEETVILIALALMLLAMLSGEFLSLRYNFLVTLVLGGVYYVLAWYFFNNFYVLPILTPLIALATPFLYHLSFGYAINTIEKAHMRNTFMKYVDPKLADQLIASKVLDSNEIGRKKDIAVLFVDVRGFTPMTESLAEQPEIIVDTLNNYLELTSSSILNNGGSVDKFIGDATMGLFNGFAPLDDYVFHAVKAAYDMVIGSDAVNEKIKANTGIDLGFGIGVHCGKAIVGNLGPSFRKDYTAIGDVVNTAARLESNAKRSQVIISEEVYEQLKERINTNYLGEIPLKGKSLPAKVYEVIGIKTLGARPRTPARG
ncbi:MAG: adenylate/guanylate cyclase domain-containing protein [Turicibacter sp.]|nr:adenylate/guanylate cyclase domain-containing protein [Turicibacter sp.]